MEEKIEEVAKDILETDKQIILTGAGISVESGIPPFRGENGLWEKYNPQEYGHINSFKRNPAKVWKMLREMLETVLKAEPNSAHEALARLEEIGYLSSVITQNVDGLHQEAGNSDVIEFHGNNRFLVCMDCHNKRKIDEDFLKEIPEEGAPECECGGVLKPDAVFFGEPIPKNALHRSNSEARDSDLLISIGTSAIVEPAASIPRIAKRTGSKVIEINPERTPLTENTSDYLLRGKAGEILPKIVSKVERRS